MDLQTEYGLTKATLLVYSVRKFFEKIQFPQCQNSKTAPSTEQSANNEEILKEIMHFAKVSKHVQISDIYENKEEAHFQMKDYSKILDIGIQTKTPPSERCTRILFCKSRGILVDYVEGSTRMLIIAI